MSQPDWNIRDVEFKINEQLVSVLGVSEEFLSGKSSTQTAAELTIKNLQNLRMEFTDPGRIAEREARQNAFANHMMDIQYRVFLKWAPFIVTRKGVTVSVVVPKAEIKTFRSLRTAKVWNKRRIKENAKRV